MAETDMLVGFTVVLSSAVSFRALGWTVQRYIPKKAQHAPWRWKNILISFIHSMLSGLWAVFCFYRDPKMAEDLIWTHTLQARILVAVSIGYFLYDTIDMLQNSRGRQSYELILHHAVIILCFGTTIVTQKYVGYATVALIVEINSIFLHLRQLLNIYGFAKTDQIYRLNSILNLGTYIIFRILTLAWMTRWLVYHRDQVPLVLFSMGSIGLAIMTVMNIILFYRLLQSDFNRRKEIEAD